jgi:hypothetical protein
MRIILMDSSDTKEFNGGCEIALSDISPELAGSPSLSGRGDAIGWDTGGGIPGKVFCLLDDEPGESQQCRKEDAE